MIVLAILVQLVGFYALYNTSQRAELRKDKISSWLQRHRTFSTIAGLSFLASSFLFLIAVQGLGAAILNGCVLLMTIGSLIIILSPLTFRTP